MLTACRCGAFRARSSYAFVHLNTSSSGVRARLKKFIAAAVRGTARCVYRAQSLQVRVPSVAAVPARANAGSIGSVPWRGQWTNSPLGSVAGGGEGGLAHARALISS